MLSLVFKIVTTSVNNSVLFSSNFEKYHIIYAILGKLKLNFLKRAKDLENFHPSSWHKC